MRRTSRTLASAALATIALSGIGHSAPWSGAGPLGARVDHAVLTVRTRNFAVAKVADLVTGDPISGYTTTGSHAADIGRLQAAIRKIRMLVHELEARNIELRNIVAVSKAVNGRYTFYVQ